MIHEFRARDAIGVPHDVVYHAVAMIRNTARIVGNVDANPSLAMTFDTSLIHF